MGQRWRRHLGVTAAAVTVAGGGVLAAANSTNAADASSHTNIVITHVPEQNNGQGQNNQDGECYLEEVPGQLVPMPCEITEIPELE